MNADERMENDIQHLLDHGVSGVPTPYLVHCQLHGRVYLTKWEYITQMNRANDLWRCPICQRESQWDDGNYELWAGD